MAASAMLAVGNVDPIIGQICDEARKIVPGTNLGAVISKAAKQRIEDYITAAERDGATQVSLTWQDNASDETSYRIERSPDGATGWVEIGTAAADATTYTDTQLSCGTYYYRVRGHRSSGDNHGQQCHIRYRGRFGHHHHRL